ncbi:tRNA dimethylallyltransferase 1 [Bacteroidia bacterium]|nr:tRNA dimethylallyltransferase 1 [Bacteroidia bacterium]
MGVCMLEKTLIVVLGPTGVGKTDFGIELARHFGTEIISCDSRQIYKEMCIGTAVPSVEQLNIVPHSFIQTQSINEYYSAWQFEQQALRAIETLHEQHDVVVMVGGSMLYIDAICQGLDDIPTINQVLRDEVHTLYIRDGLEAMQKKLGDLDPVYYEEVDLNNAKRVCHAVEVCLAAGVPYSSLRTHRMKQRNFHILKIGLHLERKELFERLDQRVDKMLEAGLEAETLALYPLRHLNALNTVAYKEFFDYFDGRINYDETVRLIKRNTRRYAKKQMTWFKKDADIHWFHPDDKTTINFFSKVFCGK